MFFLILKERLGVGWNQSLFCQSHLFYLLVAQCALGVVLEALA